MLLRGTAMMIKGIDVVYLHSDHPALGDWYSEVLGLAKGYGDAHWQEFQTEEGARFAVDFTAYPKSVVEKQAVIISFKVDDIGQAVDALVAKGAKFYLSEGNDHFRRRSGVGDDICGSRGELDAAIATQVVACATQVVARGSGAGNNSARHLSWRALSYVFTALGCRRFGKPAPRTRPGQTTDK
jgi:hypothetical protein